MSFSVMAGLVWGLLSIGAQRFFRSSRRGVLRRARGPLPALRLLGRARCRWAEPCQGRSRRRRGPKASLYKGSRTDDHRPWRDRGAEGMSVCRSFLRPASAAGRSASCIPNRELRCCRHETAPYAGRFGWVQVWTRDARHRSPRRRRSTSWSFRARRRPASARFRSG